MLCPMEIERAAVARALRRGLEPAALRRVRVERTGIGRERLLPRLSALLDASDPASPPGQRPRLILLAGVCGGLTDAGDLPPIARVIDEHGHAWTNFAGADAAGLTLIGVDRLVGEASHKADLARRTGAALVDMETHVFARACEHAGQRWGVVRGVSDGPDEPLPEALLGWMTPRGTARPARAAWDILRRPALLAPVHAALRRSRRVLPQVGSRVAELIRAELHALHDAHARPAPSRPAQAGRP